MKKTLCFFVIICCTILLFCAVPAMAENNSDGSLEPPFGSTQYPVHMYLHLWEVKRYAVDPRGFEFSIVISDRLKEYTFQSKDDLDPEIVVLERKTPNFTLCFEDNSLCGFTEDIEVYIFLEYGQKFSEYPDAPNAPDTVFSLILNEETQSTVLSGLDALVNSANLETEADAEALLPLLVQLFSAPIDYPPAEESTPAWVIGFSVGAWAAVVAVPTVALINIKRKRKRRKEAV